MPDVSGTMEPRRICTRCHWIRKNVDGDMKVMKDMKAEILALRARLGEVVP
jgi:hypothetical protein